MSLFLDSLFMQAVIQSCQRIKPSQQSFSRCFLSGGSFHTDRFRSAIATIELPMFKFIYTSVPWCSAEPQSIFWVIQIHNSPSNWSDVLYMSTQTNLYGSYFLSWNERLKVDAIIILGFYLKTHLLMPDGNIFKHSIQR